MLKIYKLGSQVLREQCEQITEFDSSLKELENKMFETMKSANGIGLAGPQIGVLKRIFVIEIPDSGIKKTFINPQIIETSIETVNSTEGCLSLPGIEHEVTRPKEVKVFAQDSVGKPFTLTASDLFARAILHENDHLNGILYIDYLDEKEKKRMEELFEKKQKALRKQRKKN